MLLPILKSVARTALMKWSGTSYDMAPVPVHLSSKGWCYGTEEIERVEVGLIQRAYENVYRKKPVADTVKAYLPLASYLVKSSGLFVSQPQGQAAEIAEKYSYQDGHWSTSATALLEIIMKHLPKHLGVKSMGIEVHAWALAKSPKKLIKEIAAFAATEGGPATGVMQSWQDSVYQRLAPIKGVELHRLPDLEAFPPWREMSPTEMMDMIFRGSPFRELLSTWVPITIPDEATRTHAHGMGPTGCGKTTFNEAKIVAELGEKGMVLIDTKGGMAKRIIGHSGRPQDILEINFSDPDQRPVFNLAQPPIGAETEHVADMMGFVLAGLGVSFTPLQSGTFEMLAKIVVSIGGATLDTFIKVIENADYAARHVQDCKEDVKVWFATQYDTTPIKAARTQIARKLWNLSGSDALNGLFNGNRNTLDFKALLDAKKLVIITISKKRFKAHTNIISRAAIAAINAAMWRRDLPINGPDWVIYFDELRDVIGTYDDSLIEELADQGREYHVCLHFTHQRLEQMSKDIQSAIINNASINFYRNIDPNDAAYLAKRMGCATGDMLNIEKMSDDDPHLYFCLSIKGYAKASLCRVRWDNLKGRPRLSDQDMERMRMSHRAYWQRVNGRFVQIIGTEKIGPNLKLITNEAEEIDDVLPWETPS